MVYNWKTEGGGIMVRFRMIRINTEQFAILCDELPEDLNNISIETRLRFKVSKDYRIAPMARFSFVKDEMPLVVIEVCCEFVIHQEDWTKMLKDNDIVVPKETLEYLSAQTIGVARGVLHCKTEGTPLNVFIVPPVNVAAMIEGDLSMELNTEEEKNQE